MISQEVSWWDIFMIQVSLLCQWYLKKLGGEIYLWYKRICDLTFQLFICFASFSNHSRGEWKRAELAIVYKRRFLTTPLKGLRRNGAWNFGATPYRRKNPLTHYWAQTNRFPVSKSGFSVILLTNLGYIWSEETRGNGFFYFKEGTFGAKNKSLRPPL